jgi:RHS repeat-associated protein
MRPLRAVHSLPALTIQETVVWRAEYEPYGTVSSFRAGASRHQPLRFPGQEYDETAPEQQYNIFRWYRAGWGRYTSPDPIGWTFKEQNLYGYAGENPLRNVDPLGLDFTNSSSKTLCVMKDALWRRSLPA